MKKTLLIVLLTLVGIGVAIALTIGTGSYDVAADAEHSPAMSRFLAMARDRSIAVRAAAIAVPERMDAERIRRGAGNYDSMCAGCHLKPGTDATELSRGLYPQPPDLTRRASLEPARAFWIIKHGIKASGMPAWGKSMEDQYIWDMVAFLMQLPSLSAEEYMAEVRASGGHSHGGSETLEAGGGDDPANAEHGEHPHEHTHSGAGEHSHQESSGSLQARDTAASEPLAAVEAFHAALTAGSAAKVAAILDPKVLIMESGNVERSRAEYASHHLPADLKFMSTMKYRLERQSGDAVGDLAWVASEARLSGESAGKPVDVVSNESLVLRKSAAGWKIVHVHWSSRDAAKAQ